MQFDTCSHCGRDLKGRYRRTPNGRLTCDNGICYSYALNLPPLKKETRKPYLTLTL